MLLITSSECKPVLEQLDQEKVGPVSGYVTIPAGSKISCKFSNMALQYSSVIKK